MRPAIAMTVLFALAACDNGGVVDQTFRTGVRQSAVQACTAWIPQSDIAAAAGLDSGTLCGCVADRMLEGKSASEVVQIRPENPETRAAIVQCVADTRAKAGRTQPG